jgi:hypothetical protein
MWAMRNNFWQMMARGLQLISLQTIGTAREAMTGMQRNDVQ